MGDLPIWSPQRSKDRRPGLLARPSTPRRCLRAIRQNRRPRRQTVEKRPAAASAGARRVTIDRSIARLGLRPARRDRLHQFSPQPVQRSPLIKTQGRFDTVSSHPGGLSANPRDRTPQPRTRTGTTRRRAPRAARRRTVASIEPCGGGKSASALRSELGEGWAARARGLGQRKIECAHPSPPHSRGALPVTLGEPRYSQRPIWWMVGCPGDGTGVSKENGCDDRDYFGPKAPSARGPQAERRRPRTGRKRPPSGE